MSGQREVITRLQDEGVLDSIRWAQDSAISRSLDDYSEDAGHDAAWLGQTLFVLFRDRLDRVFSCGRYALQAGADEGAGLDLVRIELTKKDIDGRPDLSPDLVRRINRNGSPGWALGDIQFLLSSCEFGKIAKLPWPRKSPTKQQVAMKAPLPTDLPPGLFDIEEPLGVKNLADPNAELDPFIVAHSLDPVSQRRELVFGRSRFNRGGGDAWYWYENLLTLPPNQGGRRLDAPTPSGPDNVPDAPVKLRKGASARPAMPKANGQR